MKRIISFICSLTLAISLVSVMPAYAATGEDTELSPAASGQISSYAAWLNQTSTSGHFTICYDVSGAGTMTKLGASMIIVSKYVDGSWYAVESWDTTDSGMYGTNTWTYGNTLSYYGTAGAYYRVGFTLFAQNSAGTDYRTVFRYITA